MESNKAFIDSYLILEALSPLGEIVSDHQADEAADEWTAEQENITEDRIIEGGKDATEVLEEISEKLGGDLPAARGILEHYARVEVRKDSVYGDLDFENDYFETTGEEWSGSDVDIYCENAFTLAECLLRHNDTGYWF